MAKAPKFHGFGPSHVFALAMVVHKNNEDKHQEGFMVTRMRREHVPSQDEDNNILLQKWPKELNSRFATDPIAAR